MNFTGWLVLGHFILSMSSALRVIYSRRPIGSALAWLVVLFVFPYGGLLLYLLIGETHLGRRRARHQQALRRLYAGDPPPPPPWALAPRWQSLARLATHTTGLAPAAGNRTTLHTDSAALIAAMGADMAAAQHSCRLMFYIVEAQGQIETLLETLAATARRGVCCQLLVDSLGSAAFLRSPWPARLRAAGVEVVEALPVGLLRALFVRRLDLRNHRKLLLIDGAIAYTGSFNLVDPRRFKRDEGVGHWVDVMLRLEGPTVAALARVFAGDWWLEGQALPAAEALPPANLGPGILQAIPSAPDEQSYIAYDTLIAAFYNALESITITTPYFVPDEALLNALLSAARRGVTVRILLPARNDSRLVAYAAKAYYQLLLDAGIQIHRFRRGLLHSKTVVIDREYALFGTVNMDMRSFYLNMELSLAVYDRTTVAAIAQLQEDYLAACQPVSVQGWRRRPGLQRLLERCVRLLSPLL